jgi:hypothetical protein
LHLAADPRWQALVHYQPKRFGDGVESPARGGDFFRAADGATNPGAELAATLRDFFDPHASVRDGEHPQCAFRARYHWLKRVLAFDPARLPEQSCVRFDEWRRALDPVGMTLIFPEAYMNNPASMFGHTLLRIDMGAAQERKDLLAYAVNFAADTGADGGVVFAWKGIVGSYAGFFSIRPYYETVRVYGDWENRDIWEYELTLSAPEIDMTLMHLWELRGVAFSYYFFDENCSYQLLSLLQVARPDLRLTQRLQRPWVIPVDTVRVVAEETGLVGQVRYRPSAATELRYRAERLSPRQRRLAKQIADGAVEPRAPELGQLSTRQRAAVLEVAYDSLRYTYLSKKVSRAESQGRSRQILVARSEIDVAGPVAPPAPTPAVRPDAGHRTARLAVATGWRDGRYYLEARARPAFHSLMDPAGGYTAGAQIDFLDVAVRVYPASSNVRIEEATLIDIISLSPADLFFRPISWKVSTGMQSRLLPANAGETGHSGLSERDVWHSNGGAGVAVEPWRRALAYGFAEATADVGSSLQDNYALGPGLTAGMFFGPSADWWKGHLHARVTRFALGDRSTFSQVGFDGRLTLSAQSALECTVSHNRDFDRNWIEGGIAFEVFF